jgi:LasA protease
MGYRALTSAARENAMVKMKPISYLLIAVLVGSLLSGCARKEDPAPAPGEPTRTKAGRATSLPTTPGPKVTAAPAAEMADVGCLAAPDSPAQVYTVQAGDTLSGIAARFGCNLDVLVGANSLANPNALQVGQKLQIPSTHMENGPATQLLPNSEFVNGPAYVDFDIAAFAAQQGGYLADYYEQVNGETLSGPEIVRLTAHHYSVGPRLLLTILEMKSGWVTNPSPSGQDLTYPMGYTGGGWELLSRQLAWAADALNQGYYDWRGRGLNVISWADGTATRYASNLNAATAGLQYYFARAGNKSQWQAAIGSGPDSFMATYRRLFGDPAQYAVEPLVAANTVAPTLVLPWSNGELWYYTGGPHGGWSDGSAWSALDFVPDEGFLGCQAAASWATAAAPGLVIYSQNGEVLVDLDGDGHEETGWVLFYLHLATQGRAPVGTRVQVGDPIGHPSCEGGAAESSHLHFARRYNGEWIAADGPLPMILSGWQAHSDGRQYDGTMTRSGQERIACECRIADTNGLVAGQ